MVQLRLEKEEEPWVDVGEQFYNAGLCLAWNPFPLRPFAVNSVDTKCLEPVTNSTPRDLAPSNALELENARLMLQEQYLNDSVDSGTGTGAGD